MSFIIASAHGAAPYVGAMIFHIITFKPYKTKFVSAADRTIYK